MPTRHAVRLSPAEAEALLSVVGLPLERVLVDDGPTDRPEAIKLVFDGRTLTLVPDEVATPTATYDFADVDTVYVAAERKGQEADSALSTVAADLGLARHAHVLSTVAWFEPCDDPAAFTVGDVELGAGGVGYTERVADPRDADTLAVVSAGAVPDVDTGFVELDLGVRIETDAGRSVTVISHGYYLVLTVDGGLPDDISDFVELVPVRERLAGV